MVHVSGELDLSTRHRLLAALNGISSDHHLVVIELSCTSFVDSSGLKVLLGPNG